MRGLVAKPRWADHFLTRSGHLLAPFMRVEKADVLEARPHCRGRVTIGVLVKYFPLFSDAASLARGIDDPSYSDLTAFAIGSFVDDFIFPNPAEYKIFEVSLSNSRSKRPSSSLVKKPPAIPNSPARFTDVGTALATTAGAIPKPRSELPSRCGHRANSAAVRNV